MTAQPSQSYTRLAVAILAAAVIFSAAVFASSSQPHSTVTTTSTTTVTSQSPSTVTITLMSTSTFTTTSATVSTSISYSTVSYVPLQLRVELNATTISFGKSILAQISLLNPLAENFSVVPSYPVNPVMASWNEYDFVCNSNPTMSLVGYGLYQGHYSSANISMAGDPLMLAPPVEPPCAMYLNPELFTFLPDSSTAAAYTAPNVSTTLTVGMNASTLFDMNTPVGSTYVGVGGSLFGYWSVPSPPGYLQIQNATRSSQYLHYFPAGQYTLVVEDMWGQTVYSYFQVTPV